MQMTVAPDSREFARSASTRPQNAPPPETKTKSSESKLQWHENRPELQYYTYLPSV